MKKIFLLSIITLLCFINNIHAQTLAFPGAEGFGAYATGGRNGTVYHVSNLNNDGAGSFREAVSQPNRTVVFDVSGVIHINSRIEVASNITIAGQTAPGEGIVVYGDGISFSNQHDIIVRYMRFRGSINMPKGKCTLTADSANNIIFDHLSVQWGRWDNLHVKHSNNITFQYCIIGESIDPQRFGALLERPSDLTIHHCLWIDNQSRNPKAKAKIQYINNVVYNWGTSGFVGGHSAEHYYQDIINNYFIAGPNSTDHVLSMFTATDHVFQQGNYADMNKDGVLNGILLADTSFSNLGATMLPVEQNPSPIKVTTDDAATAYAKVLKEAGASLQRDAIDLRLIGYLKSLGKEGKIFKQEADAGGQPVIKSEHAAADTDQDGIPDTWEAAHKLDPENAKDAAVITQGYSQLEKYLQDIIDARKKQAGK